MNYITFTVLLGALKPSISADGRYVAFIGWSDSLVPGDSNRFSDTIVHDILTGKTMRISIATDGTQGNGPSLFCSMSDNGQLVAFHSAASNLAPGDTNNGGDIFLRDLSTGITQCISAGPNGIPQGNVVSASISADGRFAVIATGAFNLVEGDTNRREDIFLRDLVTGQTQRVSVTSDGIQSNDRSYDAVVSRGGQYVAFTSYASNLVFADTNESQDVFLHNTLTKATTQVSIASDGSQGNRSSGVNSDSPLSISADGRWIAFESDATNLVQNDTNGKSDIFVHDAWTGTTTRVSASGGL